MNANQQVQQQTQQQTPTATAADVGVTSPPAQATSPTSENASGKSEFCISGNVNKIWHIW